MAHHLRKRRLDGTLYTRPSEIEAAIDEALRLDVQARIARAELLDRKAAEFLPKEVLVYLIRDARRADDQATLTKLFTILVRRCERVLESRVPDSYPHASDIRADTLAELAELIAKDETGEDPYRLDFFEVRFDLAFMRLHKTVGRRYRRRREHEIVADDPDNPARKPIEGALDVDGEQEPTVLRKEQMALFNRLSDDDRRLLLLRHGNDIKIESTDPNELTLARIYGVEGRTIRNRLKAARERLAKLEKNS